MFRRVIPEPAVPETVGVLGLDDAIAFCVEFDVVANAATKRARGILDNIARGVSCDSLTRIDAHRYP